MGTGGRLEWRGAIVRGLGGTRRNWVGRAGGLEGLRKKDWETLGRGGRYWGQRTGKDGRHWVEGAGGFNGLGDTGEKTLGRTGRH